MEKEIWVKTKYNCNYEVSNLARVRRLPFSRVDSIGREYFYKGMLMKEGRNGSTNYRGVSLQGVSYRLHRLVYFSFNPDADESLEINHIDHNPSNNNLSNLELVTRQENIEAYLDFYDMRAKQFFCKDCGKIVTFQSIRCKTCKDLKQRRVEDRPSKEDLIEELKNSNYTQMGRKYGVSDNAIRKWLK